MGTTSSTSAPSKHARHFVTTLPLLNERGINLLAIDFDMTILDCHTGGLAKLRGFDGAADVATHVRPFFAALIASAPLHGLAVAVVTFSGEIELIRQVLQIAVGEEAAAKVLICGADGSWDRRQPTAAAAKSLSHEGLDWRTPAQLSQGKNPWLANVWEKLASQAEGQGGERYCGPGRTVLIDDDINNIRAAREIGCSALWFNPTSGDGVGGDDAAEDALLCDGLDQLAATRRLLFLDVDGVLNSGESRAPGRDAGPDWDAPQPAMLASLAWVVKRTAAEIVVSSTWRLQDEQYERLRQALAAHGLRVVGATDDLSTTMRHDRPDEIVQWVVAANGMANGTAGGDDDGEGPAAGGAKQRGRRPARGERQAEPAWVAIDDMDLTTMNPTRMPSTHFVRTDDRVGLLPAKAVEAADKLLAAAVAQLPRLQ